MDVPGEPIRAQLVEHITAGLDPEAAARLVLEPYGQVPLAVLAEPLVLRTARDVEGALGRRLRRQAFGGVRPGGGVGLAEVLAGRTDAQARLRTSVYRLPDGTRALWDDLTGDEIDRKIAWLRAHIGSLVEHLALLEGARKLLAEHGVDRLGDIDDWPALLDVDTEQDQAA